MRKIMPTSEEKINKLKSRIKAHRAMIESLRTQIKAIEQDRPYGSTKNAWLKTVKCLTSPFASANKNVNEYINNPDLYHLKDTFEEAEKLLAKINDNDEKLFNLKYVEKFLEKLEEIEKAIYENPAMITSDLSNDDETKILTKLEQVKALLNNQKRLLEMPRTERGEMTESQAVELFEDLQNVISIKPQPVT